MNIDSLDNLAVRKLDREFTVELQSGMPNIIQLSVIAQEKVSPRWGKHLKHTYRLNGDRISRLAADLLLQAYKIKGE